MPIYVPIFSAFLSIALLTLCGLRPEAPDYISKKALVVPGVFGLLSVAVMGLFVNFGNLFLNLGYVVSGTVLIWTAIHSVFTDISYYKVDRWILRLAIALVLVASLPQFILYKFYFLPILIILILLSSAMFFSDKFGASDARALVLAVSASFMNFSYMEFYYAAIATTLGCLLYAVYFGIKEKKWKAKVALVPPILTPFAIAFAIFAL